MGGVDGKREGFIMHGRTSRGHPGRPIPFETIYVFSLSLVALCFLERLAGGFVSSGITERGIIRVDGGRVIRQCVNRS